MAQRRTDLCQWAQAFHLGLIEQQVLRARVRYDELPSSLGDLEMAESGPGAQVHDIDGAAGRGPERNGSLNLLGLRPRRAGGRVFRRFGPPLLDSAIV